MQPTKPSRIDEAEGRTHALSPSEGEGGERAINIPSRWRRGELFHRVFLSLSHYLPIERPIYNSNNIWINRNTHMTRPNSSVSYVLRFPSSSFSFSIKEARNSLSRFSISSSVHLSIIKSKCKETETLNQTLKGFPTLHTPVLYTEPFPSSPFYFGNPFGFLFCGALPASGNPW